MADAKKNMTFEIPIEGSLGILALGAVGIKAWRKMKKEAKPTSRTAK